MTAAPKAIAQAFPLTIAIAGGKGVGKTTIAANLARAITRQDRRVKCVILDVTTRTMRDIDLVVSADVKLFVATPDPQSRDDAFALLEACVHRGKHDLVGAGLIANQIDGHDDAGLVAEMVPQIHDRFSIHAPLRCGIHRSNQLRGSVRAPLAAIATPTDVSFAAFRTLARSVLGADDERLRSTSTWFEQELAALEL